MTKYCTNYSKQNTFDVAQHPRHPMAFRLISILFFQHSYRTYHVQPFHSENSFDRTLLPYFYNVTKITSIKMLLTWNMTRCFFVQFNFLFHNSRFDTSHWNNNNLKQNKKNVPRLNQWYSNQVQPATTLIWAEVATIIAATQLGIEDTRPGNSKQ